MGDDPNVNIIPDTGKELIAPLNEHTERITRIEETQARKETEFIESLNKVREDLFQAIEESRKGMDERLQERINHLEALEARLEEKLASHVPEPPPIPTTPVPIPEPPIVPPPPPPPPPPRGIRGRRHARRKRE